MSRVLHDYAHNKRIFGYINLVTSDPVVVLRMVGVICEAGGVLHLAMIDPLTEIFPVPTSVSIVLNPDSVGRPIDMARLLIHATEAAGTTIKATFGRDADTLTANQLASDRRLPFISVQPNDSIADVANRCRTLIPWCGVSLG